MGKNILRVDGINFKMNDSDFDMWGIRLANGLENDRTTYDIVNNLDTYKSYGINTFSVFLMGGSTGSSNPFTCEGDFNWKLRGSGLYCGRGDCEGFYLKNSYLDRLAVLIEEADRRGMVVNLGIFYQMRIDQLTGTEAILNALRKVARWLNAKAYKNVFMDLVNEYGHPGYEGRNICRGFKYRGCEDGGEILIDEFKAICPDIPVSMSGCGVDVNGARKKFYEFANQDFFLIHKSIDPEIIRKETGREIPVVCNEWGAGIALEPGGHLGQWTYKDSEEWKKAVGLIRKGCGKMFIFSHWKQYVTLDGPHFEAGPSGTQPNPEREGEPSDLWMFDMVKSFKEQI